ncbi:hypothetical protein A1507_22225 [Methylomonas koyamae]|uniref:G domain-containing protein n=1 Tax=Methylomonas koyamae TaxID=702114 RepID=A0A177NSQ4_9GAMM|nr:dynamin family protein [Methylomonas koyamae]OAI21025.1 hypothetical protein A1507_22225 [Methylomonas koyamae]
MTAIQMHELVNVLEKAKPILNRAFDNDPINKEQVAKRDNLLRKDADKCVMRTIVFGYYNSGKSTLINALLGREEAPVGAVPLTDKVTAYHWRAHELLDSPGIDAPIEHEDVTTRQLQQCHAVIFVIPMNGVIEEQDTWDKLCRLVQEGKTVMIVINDKEGRAELGSADFILFRDQLWKNLQEAAKSYEIQDIPSKVSVHFVKAKSALKAKLENKNKLLEASGLLTLEHHLTTFFNDQLRIVYQSNHRNIQELLDSAEQSLSSKEGNSYCKALVDGKIKIQAEKESLSLNLRESARMAFLQEKTKIAGRISGILTLKEDIPERISREVEKSLDHIGHKLNQQIEEEIGASLSHLEDIDCEFITTISGISTAQTDFNLQSNSFSLYANNSATSEQPQSSSLSDMLNDFKISPAGVGEHVETASLFTLEYGKKFFPELFKGIGTKTMEKWASVAGKYAGPIMSIVTALYSLWQASKSEEEERRAFERQVAAIMTEVNGFLDEACANYLLQVKSTLNELFSPILANIDENVRQAQQESDSDQKDRELLLALRETLDQISV